jgi:NAD(P)H-dependent FMN reductase
MLNVLVILGSVRRGRMSERVATFVMARLAAAGNITADLVDLAVLDLPIMEERLGRIDPPPPGVAELGAKIRAADAMIIVSPEYNHGYPGVLKNTLDYFYAEYKRTPVALVTVSNGGHGGVNAWAQLVTVMVQLGAIVLPATVAVSHVETSFSPEGEALETAYVRRMDRLVEELSWLASRLKA